MTRDKQRPACPRAAAASRPCVFRGGGAGSESAPGSLGRREAWRGCSRRSGRQQPHRGQPWTSMQPQPGAAQPVSPPPIGNISNPMSAVRQSVWGAAQALLVDLTSSDLAFVAANEGPMGCRVGPGLPFVRGRGGMSGAPGGEGARCPRQHYLHGGAGTGHGFPVGAGEHLSACRLALPTRPSRAH